MAFKGHFSVLDIFSIGIGPSSSHTVGPMCAAASFARRVDGLNVARIKVSLHGSLADTGKGHGTDKAILLGLLGEEPETIDVDLIPAALAKIEESKELRLPSGKTIQFVPSQDLNFVRGSSLPRHPNGMHFVAVDIEENILLEELVYSVGGGFIVTEADWGQDVDSKGDQAEVPYPFHCASELLALCEQHSLSIAELVMANELTLISEEGLRTRLDQIWSTMQACIERGVSTDGILPGGLKVKRRAKEVHADLLGRGEALRMTDPLTILDWVNLYALAVNEENAAGGRVVTAPTNGAAGILPAVLRYASEFRTSAHSDGVHQFLLTAGAIATLYKRNASLSGADVGCQGEVGVACSMAAGALTAYLGGTPQQIESAAEIGMEHNLGLTCDPIGGLVQIPCIERNAMGAVKAINASRLAMSSDGTHFVSLDKVIKTMAITGRDMMDKYKETARGGLAVNVVEC